MSDTGQSRSHISAGVIARFEITNTARDRAITEGRQITRLSANAVRAIHRAEFDDANGLLDQARRLLRDLVDHLGDHPALYWQGYVQDATREYAEASLTMAMVRNLPWPTPEQLGVEDAPYLNGLAEAASELRREVLDHLRTGNLARAEQLMHCMNDVYDLLVSIDFPDGITGGLRRTTDQLRAVLERTRNDLTITLTQERLRQALRDTERLLLNQQNKP